MVRKSILSLVIIALLLTMFASIPIAQAQTPIRVTINGTALALEVAPVVQGGRTLVPMRAIFEALGARVHFDGATSLIRAARRETMIILQIGNKNAWVNGPEVEIEAAPVMIQGRTMVPLRFVAEALDAEVNWNANTRVVAITHTPYARKPIGGTITYGSIADPVILNPILFTDTASGEVMDRTHWGLVRFDQENQPMNAIADRWSWNQQTLTWRFWLNPSAKWHDGRPVTARDVKFTYETVLADGYDGPRRADFALIDSITVVNDHTVDIKMKQIDAPFIFRLGLGLLPHHILGNVPVRELRAHAYNRNPIGNGPYMFGRWVSGQFVELRRNPNFFQGPRPYISTVVIRTYPDLNVMQTAWEAGDVDWFAALTVDHIDRIMREHDGRAYFREVPLHGYDYFSFNLENQILADRRVREALVVGLDRTAMVDTVLDRRGSVLNAHQPRTSWASGAPNLNLYEHSAVRARQMLDAAGWRLPAGAGRDAVREKDGKRLTLRLTSNAGNVIRTDLSDMAIAYWRRIGVQVTQEVVEWSVMLDRFARGDYDMMIIGWSLGLDPDPYAMFHSSQAERVDGRIMTFNRGSFKNAEADRLIEAARATVSIPERRRLYRELDQLLNRELPYIWIFQRIQVAAVANRIQGATWSPTGDIWPETKFIQQR